MKFIRLYLRVLELLGREARLGWTLAVANVYRKWRRIPEEKGSAQPPVIEGEYKSS